MIEWTLDVGNPVVRPGGIQAEFDGQHAGAGHIVQLGEVYRMY